MEYLAAGYRDVVERIRSIATFFFEGIDDVVEEHEVNLEL